MRFLVAVTFLGLAVLVLGAAFEGLLHNDLNTRFRALDQAVVS